MRDENKPGNAGFRLWDGAKTRPKLADPEMRKNAAAGRQTTYLWCFHHRNVTYIIISGGRFGWKRSRKTETENGSGKHTFYAVRSAKKWPYFEGPVRGPEMMRKMADLGRGVGQKSSKKWPPGNAEMMRRPVGQPAREKLVVFSPQKRHLYSFGPLLGASPPRRGQIKKSNL